MNLSWEYRSGPHWFVTNVAARHPSSGPFRAEDGVYGFHVQPLDRSLRELNAFTLRDRSGTHYVWLLGVIGLPIFCVGAALRLATAKGLPKRWVWAPFALVGITSMSLNWTTGDVAVRVLTIQLVSVGAIKSGAAAPWILSVAFPLGAILGLARYRHWRRGNGRPASHESEGTVSPPSPEQGEGDRGRG